MLKVSACCEIGDLQSELVRHTGKSYDEVEKGLFDTGTFPESSPTFLWNEPKYFDDDDKHWCKVACYELMRHVGVKEMYVTMEV